MQEAHPHLPQSTILPQPLPNSSKSEPPVILMAEDDRMTRQMMRHILAKDGYRVIETDDGASCLAAYQQTPPNLVLLDAIMPGMNGFDCCQQLTTLPESHYTPILMITGLEDQASVNLAFEVGASDYITKPIHWPVLRQRVRLQIERMQLYKQLEAVNQKLTRLASLDELTQLPNRRIFSETLYKEWRRMAREQKSLSLIMADIDYFKAYNDTYGHLIGDRCLSQVAKVFSQAVRRPGDIPARYGGEEFAVILPNTSLAGAMHVAGSIRLLVQALAIPHRKSLNSAYVSVSLGVASVVPNHEGVESEMSLIAAADKALYFAKESGRNQVQAAQMT